MVYKFLCLSHLLETLAVPSDVCSNSGRFSCRDKSDLHCRMGLTKQVGIIVGLPFLTSTSSLRFWITLCDAWSVEGVNALVNEFRMSEAGGKADMQAFCNAWNADLIRKVKLLRSKKPNVSLMFIKCFSTCRNKCHLPTDQNLVTSCRLLPCPACKAYMLCRCQNRHAGWQWTC